MYTEFDIGFLLGLLVGEGSFTGDRKQPAVQVKMHSRHTKMLQQMREKWGGRLYGPYEHQGRRYVTWMVRRKDLLRLLVILDDHVDRVPDEKLHNRWRRLKKRYGLSQQFELLD